jgi:CHAT domain-containing protein
LKALVIADPGGARFALKGGPKEGKDVARTLEDHGVKTKLLIGSPQPGTGAALVPGVSPASYEDVIELLLEGEFDIVHYCGHATFDERNPGHTGWVFEGGILSATELLDMEEAPKLVVANACLSAKVSRKGEPVGAEPSSEEMPTGHPLLVAGLADEFFKQGVFDYIGAAWEVPSEPASVFAAEFYGALLSTGNSFTLPIGKAVLAARTRLYRERKKFGPAWAAYQHYGDPTRQLSQNKPSR